MRLPGIQPSIRSIVLIWLAWAAITIGFQALVRARFDLQRPDTVLPWTVNETQTERLPRRPYLIDPFMNYQVAWDSEYYLSIATVGYDDPNVGTAPPEWRPELRGHEPVPLNYAFFPFYPLMIRVLRLPLLVLGMTPIATSTLAGVIVSLLGTLGAMLALYDLTRDELEEHGGLRAAFYLIAFPTGFFLAMVYSEGLFAGLAFGALALLRRKQWPWAAALAACATWTRAVGVALVIPLAIAWFEEWRARGFSFSADVWKLLGRALLVLAPVAAYFIWRAVLGEKFDFVETAYFGRGVLQPASLDGWREGFNLMWLGERYRPDPFSCWAFTGLVAWHNRLYYVFEFVATAFAATACLLTLRRHPGLSAFGLAVLAISFGSGNACVAQGMPRYVLAVPSVFIVLAAWGRSETFDRIWAMASVLLMGLLAAVFAFNFWVE